MKTERQNTDQIRPELTIDEYNLEQVTEFTYRGSLVTENNDLHKDLQNAYWWTK